MADTEQVDHLVEPADATPESPDGVTVQPDDLAVQPGSPAGQPTVSTAEPDRLTRNAQLSNWTVLAMIILCFFVIVQFRPFASRNTGEVKTLSDLGLQPLTGQGQPVKLADLTGRVVLLNFWEPQSSASRKALPQLAAVERQFRGRSAFRLLSVSCRESAKEDFRTLRKSTRAALEKKNVDFPTYGDAGGVSRSAVDQAIGLSDYPTTLILDRQGRIRGAWTGFQPEVKAEMQQLVARLLDEG